MLLHSAAWCILCSIPDPGAAGPLPDSLPPLRTGTGIFPDGNPKTRRIRCLRLFLRTVPFVLLTLSQICSCLTIQRRCFMPTGKLCFLCLLLLSRRILSRTEEGRELRRHLLSFPESVIPRIKEDQCDGGGSRAGRRMYSPSVAFSAVFEKSHCVVQEFPWRMEDIVPVSCVVAASVFSLPLWIFLQILSPPDLESMKKVISSSVFSPLTVNEK